MQNIFSSFSEPDGLDANKFTILLWNKAYKKFIFPAGDSAFNKVRLSFKILT